MAFTTKPQLKRLTHDAAAYADKRWALIQRARDVMAANDPRDPDDLDNATLEQIVAGQQG